MFARDSCRTYTYTATSINKMKKKSSLYPNRYLQYTFINPATNRTCKKYYDSVITLTTSDHKRMEKN